MLQLIKSSSLSSSIIIIFIELDQNLQYLDEQIKHIDKEHKCMTWYIFVTTLCSFNYDLSIKDYVKALYQKSDHQVAHVISPETKEPSSQPIQEHELDECHDDSAQKKHGPPLAEQTHTSERNKGDSCVE